MALKTLIITICEGNQEYLFSVYNTRESTLAGACVQENLGWGRGWGVNDRIGHRTVVESAWLAKFRNKTRIIQSPRESAYRNRMTQTLREPIRIDR